MNSSLSSLFVEREQQVLPPSCWVFSPKQTTLDVWFENEYSWEL